MSEAMIGSEVVTTSGDGVSESRTFIVAVYVSTLSSPGANFVKEDVTHSLVVSAGRLERHNMVATSSVNGPWQLKGYALSRDCNQFRMSPRRICHAIEASVAVFGDVHG